MGTQNSKVENIPNDELTEGSLPSTAISTPKTRAMDLDPRSPSANIVRTPIQMIQNLNKTPVVGVISSTTSDGNIDPRSPAIDFIRTPIGTEAIKIRNKNLDKVRQQLSDVYSPNKINETPEKLNKIIGPKLLGVSPVIVRSEQSQKRNSYIGLLETDLDYIETNLDTIATEHDNLIAHIEAITEEEKYIRPEDEINKVEDIRSEHIEEVNEEKVVPKESSFKALEEIGARALKIAADIETGPKMEVSSESEITTPKDESVITPIKQTLERLSQIDKEIDEVIAFSPTAEDLNPTQEFDKKIANLIYEDEDFVGRMPKTLKENTGNRTPLGDKNLNQRHRKSKHRLSDKPMDSKKHEYAVSKIPVYKEKKGKSKIVTQCENTPPRQKQNKEITKTRKSQWDADNTLII